MKSRTFYSCLVLAASVAAIGVWMRTRVLAGNRGSGGSYSATWSPQAAADYLDRREVWWQGWPVAQRDRGTICISCHTVVPYATMRSALSRQLRETEMPATEHILMGSVEKRVALWSKVAPFYADTTVGPSKGAESRATEAVLNAIILLAYDAQEGHLRSITRIALEEAWQLQEKAGENAGGWKWLDFHLAPWESAESAYQGATWLMLQVENAPDEYARQPQVQDNLEQVKQYLRKYYVVQPVINQIYILWLSSKVSGLLTSAEQNTLLDLIQQQQQPDGGWILSSLDLRNPADSDQWQHTKENIQKKKLAESDGYATALVVLALEESGACHRDPTLPRGLEWLKRHQQSDGSWRTDSLNARRDPQSDIGRFMSDAATAYAVLALENGAVAPSQC